MALFGDISCEIGGSGLPEGVRMDTIIIPRTASVL